MSDNIKLAAINKTDETCDETTLDIKEKMTINQLEGQQGLNQIELIIGCDDNAIFGICTNKNNCLQKHDFSLLSKN